MRLLGDVESIGRQLTLDQRTLPKQRPAVDRGMRPDRLPAFACRWKHLQPSSRAHGILIDDGNGHDFLEYEVLAQRVIADARPNVGQ
jgi:hypothetical protein